MVRSRRSLWYCGREGVGDSCLCVSGGWASFIFEFGLDLSGLEGWGAKVISRTGRKLHFLFGLYFLSCFGSFWLRKIQKYFFLQNNSSDAEIDLKISFFYENRFLVLKINSSYNLYYDFDGADYGKKKNLKATRKSIWKFAFFLNLGLNRGSIVWHVNLLFY